MPYFYIMKGPLSRCLHIFAAVQTKNALLCKGAFWPYHIMDGYWGVLTGTAKGTVYLSTLRKNSCVLGF